jgi:hypothetical protein
MQCAEMQSMLKHIPNPVSSISIVIKHKLGHSVHCHVQSHFTCCAVYLYAMSIYWSLVNQNIEKFIRDKLNLILDDSNSSTKPKCDLPMSVSSAVEHHHQKPQLA